RVLEGHDGGGRAKYATASSLESTDREHRSASLRGGVFAFAGVSLSLTGSSASRAGSSAPRIGEFLALAERSASLVTGSLALSDSRASPRAASFGGARGWLALTGRSAPLRRGVLSLSDASLRRTGRAASLG